MNRWPNVCRVPRDLQVSGLFECTKSPSLFPLNTERSRGQQRTHPGIPAVFFEGSREIFWHQTCNSQRKRNDREGQERRLRPALCVVGSNCARTARKTCARHIVGPKVPRKIQEGSPSREEANRQHGFSVRTCFTMEGKFHDRTWGALHTIRGRYISFERRISVCEQECW